MREPGPGIVVSVAGALAGRATVMAGGIVRVGAFGVFDREGAIAMGAAVGIGPAVGAACGGTGASAPRRRRARCAPTCKPPPRWPDRRAGSLPRA